MYGKIKTILAKYPRHYYLLVSAVILALCCAGYILYQPSGGDYQRARNAVERIESQQRESIELNQRIQSHVDRSTEYSREAGERISRSQDYNRQIDERIGTSQERLNEARGYLERNADLYRRIEERNRKGQSDNQTATDAAEHSAGVRNSGNSDRCANQNIAR